MSAANPITVSADQQVALVSRATEGDFLSEQNSKSSFGFGNYAADVVEISQLGRSKQQQEIQQQASQKIKKLANEVVRVTSTIGKSRSAGNLTQTQATELYNQIAALL
jgi:hypothetical protein